MMVATDWHVITVTRGGTVSILRNLDEVTAREAMSRLDPHSEVNFQTGMRIARDGDIKTVHLLGPKDAQP